jgi:hypothetical protein
MLINVKSVGFNDRETLTALADGLGLPAVLADESLKLITKNSAFSKTIPNLRKGSGLSSFFMESARDEIQKMSQSDVFATRLTAKNGATFGVIVLGGSDCRLLVFNAIGADMIERVNELYHRMSGFDDGIIGFDPNSDFLPIRGTKAAAAKALLSKVLSDISSVRSLPFFNASDVIKAIYSAVASASRPTNLSGPPHSERLKLGLGSDEMITHGCARDLALILSFSIAFCLDNGESSPVFLETSASDGEIEFLITSRTDLSVYDVAKMTAIYNDEDDENKNFWFYMIRLLADANLWSFSTEARIDGTVVFKLKTPFTESVESLLLRDSIDEEVTTIINIFFS